MRWTSTLEPEKYKLTVRAEPTDSSIKLANSTESISLAWSWRWGATRS